MIIKCQKCSGKLKTLFISEGYKFKEKKQKMTHLSDFLYCKSCNEIIKVEVNLK